MDAGLHCTLPMRLFRFSCIGLSRLVSVYFLSQNIIHSNSPTLFMRSAEQVNDAGSCLHYTRCCIALVLYSAYAPVARLADRTFMQGVIGWSHHPPARLPVWGAPICISEDEQLYHRTTQVRLITLPMSTMRKQHVGQATASTTICMWVQTADSKSQVRFLIC